jgi:hypothetical protein
MSKKIEQKFPIQFPTNLYDSLSGLVERKFMTPSYLSKFVMFPVLPAKLSVEKKKPLINDENGFCTMDSLFSRSNLDNRYFSEFKTDYYDVIAKTHTLSSLIVDGLETLEVKQKKQNNHPQYEIFCCGNGQDAMHFVSVYSRIQAQANKNYVFWNYPGVGFTARTSHTPDDLSKAGYQQAKRLLDQGIPAENITLHGLSLGGGVAARVARQLHEEGHLVGLEIDRSFSRISSVVPEIIQQKLIHQETAKQSNAAPLLTSIVACAISGIALGMTFAGFMASIGLVTASVTAAIGYIGAYCFQTIGLLLQELMTMMGEIFASPFGLFSASISKAIKSLFSNVGYCLAYSFELIGFAVNEAFSVMASLLNSAFNMLGSFVGGAIAVVGLVAGAIAGLVLGTLLSMQLLWTEKPFTMPMKSAFYAALSSACCEMDSVREIERLLQADNKPNNRAKKQPSISVTNVMDDEIIGINASLSAGLGLKPDQQSEPENQRLKEKITSFWYRHGGHNGALYDPVEPDVSFSL